MAKKLNTQEQVLDPNKIKRILTPLNNMEELNQWMIDFIDLAFPMGHVYPTSNSSPIEAMWEIYRLIKTRENKDCPEVTLLASRDSFKTLAASAMEVLLMCHFRISVAHLAAISSQSAKSIQYVQSFFRKIGPYLEANGWTKTSDSKSRIEWITDKLETVYINIIICTIAGANSEHCPLLFRDEIDVIADPRALEESKMIPSVMGDIYPLTVNLSTRKFAGGLMEKTLKTTLEAGGQVLRWNILDVCEDVATKTEAKANGVPRFVRYVSKELPMSNISEEEYNALTAEKKAMYDKMDVFRGFEQLGYLEHPFLSVMRHYLVQQSKKRPTAPHHRKGGLYKPIQAVINNFKQVSTAMAEAQLLCNKPSTVGLVYPRFEEELNTLSVEDAYTQLFGEKPYKKDYALSDLVKDMHKLGVRFFGGADWGWTDETSLVVLAVIPGGQVWIMDNFSAPGLEIDEIVMYAKEFHIKYKIEKWYCDNARPAYLKRFNREGMKAPKVVKNNHSIIDGITATQSKILGVNNKRNLMVIRHNNTKRIIDCFGEYKWKVDGKGDAIDGMPDHDRYGVSDIMDSLRYPMQVLFGERTRFHFEISDKSNVDSPSENIMLDKIKSLATHNSSEEEQKKTQGGLHFTL